MRRRTAIGLRLAIALAALTLVSACEDGGGEVSPTATRSVPRVTVTDSSPSFDKVAAIEHGSNEVPLPFMNRVRSSLQELLAECKGVTEDRLANLVLAAQQEVEEITGRRRTAVDVADGIRGVVPEPSEGEAECVTRASLWVEFQRPGS